MKSRRGSPHVTGGRLGLRRPEPRSGPRIIRSGEITQSATLDNPGRFPPFDPPGSGVRRRSRRPPARPRVHVAKAGELPRPIPAPCTPAGGGAPDFDSESPDQCFLPRTRTQLPRDDVWVMVGDVVRFARVVADQKPQSGPVHAGTPARFGDDPAGFPMTR